MTAKKNISKKYKKYSISKSILNNILLKKSKEDVRLVGNIGFPALS